MHILGKCQVCGKRSPLISDILGVCLDCIRKRSQEAIEITKKVHATSRRAFCLPINVPRTPSGIRCGTCSNDCKIKPNLKGYCGLVTNTNNHLRRLGGIPEKGILNWYYDPLPTNCVAEWFCPGCTGVGYPTYAYRPNAETSYANLAVFYGACSFDCLFCQNWHYRFMSSKLQPTMSSRELASKVRENVSCICYFGGDPSVQMLHALETSRIALKEAKGNKRILRICWETNGYWKRELAIKAAEFSLFSGGVVKVDLKSWNNSLNIALCGVPNIPSLENIKAIGEKFFNKRSEVPVLTASSLLVPGYVDEDEVANLSNFIADIDTKIPYTLLAFSPQYMLTDLPTTSKDLAFRCYDIAKRNLEKVRIGNILLLS